MPSGTRAHAATWPSSPSWLAPPGPGTSCADVEYTLARSRYKFDDLEAYMATAYSVRDRLIEEWNDTQSYFKAVDPKRVYYLSMEFLMGRSLLNALYNTDIKDQVRACLWHFIVWICCFVEQRDLWS